MYVSIYLWLYSPCGLLLPFQFLNVFTVGRFFGGGISRSQGRYLHTEQHKHRINAHASSGIQTHGPSVHALDREVTVIGI
jgi:hypothetical protein